MNAEQKYTIGTKVKYFAIKSMEHYKEVIITSKPWVMGGDVVIKINDRPGCVSVENLELFD